MTNETIGVTVINQSIQSISVIVPENPFAPKAVTDRKHCLTALDVEKLIEWWPGKPHVPHRNANKVKSIQRALDWKRVSHIASYLLQREILDARETIDDVFGEIYNTDDVAEWPPKVPKVIGFQRSVYPTFSNVLLHVNGAKVTTIKDSHGAATLTFNDKSPDLNFSVIDGQHRINGAYLAVMILRKEGGDSTWEIPAEIFLDLDEAGQPPRHQAQIFIDVNFNQKKVDRSLVADLFPTARGKRGPLDVKERAQDLGRRLMLEEGPLVGMIQIPGIKFGVKDVVTLATLNSAIEKVIPFLSKAGLESLQDQAAFLAQCLDAWLTATGRKEEVDGTTRISSSNVVYQSRVLVSFLTLVPLCLYHLQEKRKQFVSTTALKELSEFLKTVIEKAGLAGRDGRFMGKDEFKTRGYLGSGGMGRFRDCLWASSLSSTSVKNFDTEQITSKANKHRETVYQALDQ